MEISIPPLFTTLRVNETEQVDSVIKELEAKLKILYSANGYSEAPVIFQHSQLKSTIVIPTLYQDIMHSYPPVIVDHGCGMAVLRGADVFVPGILCMPTGVQVGDKVSVCADIGGSCLRGMTRYEGQMLFVGNGVMLKSRNDIFKGNNITKGSGIRMECPIFLSLCLNDVLPSKIFAQNLPSIIVGHVLNPQEGDIVLDMCAAPGGKTSHIVSLLRGRGRLVAVDRSSSKVEKIKQNAAKLGQMADVLTVFTADSRKLCSDDSGDKSEENKFSSSYFDKILLDAPCSALGQRPKCWLENQSNVNKMKNIKSYPALQRQLFNTAVRLLKPGGTLVYSTCTTTVDENEGLVEWALDKHPCLKLSQHTPHIGGTGRQEVTNLSPSNLHSLQYFTPGSPVTCVQEHHNVHTIPKLMASHLKYLRYAYMYHGVDINLPF
uniref:putative methyltransferase NSUN6 isoform X2 n=1 Tax=Ciona intestinalis TaxID=7719 RepID=UPI000EF52C3C|nr:putative methyltransferase NSUN6 isoform X2 [Ciona intestinalis]|eukprot:XP_026695690.1 putative methyltransferase NSUN6 isoform X2 [Ciona intestinalis]